MKHLLVVLLVLLFSTPAFATTYYVDPTASNCSTYNPATRTCSGGSATNRTTVQAGAGLLTVPGDLLYIRGGTYDTILLETDFGAMGSSGNFMTVAGYPGETVIIAPTFDTGGVMRFSSLNRPGTQYVHLVDLILEGINTGASGGGAVIAVEATNHINLTRVTLRNGGSNGALVNQDNATWIDVNVTGNGRAPIYHGSNGIYWAGGSGNLVKGGEFSGNECYAVRFFNSGPEPAASNNVVDGIYAWGNGDSVAAPDGDTSCPSGGGGVVFGDNANTLMNSVIAHNGDRGFTVSNGAAGSETGMRVINNTFYDNQQGVFFEIGSAEFRNNISLNQNNNLFSTIGGNLVQSNNITSGSVEFVDVNTDNFRLQATANNAINQGFTINTTPAVTTDFDDIARPQGGLYDIGAFEFVAGDPTPPVVTITSPTSSPTFLVTTTPLTSLAGTCTDNIGVSSVTWVNAQGGSGTAAGTTAWSVGSINLASGDNVITVTCTDTGNNSHQDVITVTFTVDPGAPTVRIRGVRASLEN